MQINLGKPQSGERSGVIKKGKTTISPNPKREREMLNSSGDVIDPKTKQVIRLSEL